MYSSRPGLLIGYHGCDRSVRDAIVADKAMLRASQNKYDWLGAGYYFWEDNYGRALDFAAHPPGKKQIMEPAVLTSKDLLLRELDCAVIENLHTQRTLNNKKAFDSVRGLFVEGHPLYEGAGFQDKNHIQICIRNPNCIRGFFKPREEVQWIG